MIERAKLVADCQKLLRRMEEDIREWTAQDEVLTQRLREDHAALLRSAHTGAAYETWLDEEVTQAAASWVLGCVFVRFMEDNDLIAQPYIAGPTGSAGKENRLERAQQYRSAYFRERPADSDRNYLLHVFAEVGKIPACCDLFARDRNPLWRLSVSGDGAGELIRFWQEANPDTGRLVRDLVTDDISDTRFLGDLYQDLSESARKKYALLQTPEFVEEFILEHTLDPAVETFGLEGLRMIDPACGSGHFLLGSFRRLLQRWEKQAPPGAHTEDLVRRVLESVHGVDINPFAVAIARFRLMVAALVACGRKRLSAVPAFPLNLAAGDSLLMGSGMQMSFKEPSGCSWGPDYLVQGDFEVANSILSKRYHAVVANPPYITVKDKALNQAYRDRYATCHRQYSLAVPFMERIYGLCCDCGFTGQITTNSFMKREFGKKLIEKFLARTDLTHVIDTSGAYIPGHGTPTVILFGRKRAAVSNTVRAVMGIKGEPTTPADPAQGLVWCAIREQVGQPGSQSAFVSVADIAREQFARHPWSIGGGGAAELKELLDTNRGSLKDCVEHPIGRAVRIAEEDVFMFNGARLRHSRCGQVEFRGFLIGERIRDWRIFHEWWVWYPYRKDAPDSDMLRQLWAWRSTLTNRATFQGVMADAGYKWWEYMQHTSSAYRTPLSIVFAFVATHNHFVLDRGGKVFKQSAPVIKLPEGATEDEHLELLGLLNSSTACFWMQQTMHNKGGPGGACSKDEKWHDFYDFSAGALASHPIPNGRPLQIALRLDALARELSETAPAAIVTRSVPEASLLAYAKGQMEHLRGEMITWQEELDWACYGLYGLLDGPPRSKEPPPLMLGQRDFEIVLARQMADGSADTKWFSWLGITPVTEIPPEWPQAYRAIVQKRIEIIEKDQRIALIESPACKRRWETEPWHDQARKALYIWLCDRLEDRRYWPEEPELVSCRQLADRLRQDTDFLQVAALYRQSDTFDITSLVQELVEAEAVPYLPALRYKESGTQHAVRVLYMNVREANDENLRSSGDDWKIVIDYPFDRPGHGRADDAAKVQEFRRRHAEGARTIVWLPSFFSEAGLRDLGNLVVMDFVLSGERFSGYAAHLSPQDHQSAKAILDNQRAASRQKTVTALESAYGLHKDTMGMIEQGEEEGFADHFRSLLPGFEAKPPAATNLCDGMQHLIEQALEHQFPGHPKFEMELKLASLRRIHEYAGKAIASEDLRVPVDRPHRSEMKLIAEPLDLGQMGDTHFAIGRHWVDHFEKQMAREAKSEPTVRDLMGWMDLPQPCGLEPRVRFLVIKLFADMTDRSFYQYGAATGEVAFDGLDPQMELRPVPLPSRSVWDQAVARAGALFGLTAPGALKAATVKKLSAEVMAKIEEHIQPVRQLASELREAHVRAGAEPGSSDRLRVAVEVDSLMAALQQAGEGKVVETLSGATLTDAPVHLGRTVAGAHEALQCLRAVNWEDLLDALELPEPLGTQATRLLEQARQALVSHELSSPLKSSLPPIERQLDQLRDRQRKSQQEDMERQRQALEEERRRIDEERRSLERAKQKEPVKEDEELPGTSGDTFELVAAIKDIDQKLEEIRGRVKGQPPDSTVAIRVRVLKSK